jgi:hypothetical protein
MCNVFAPILYFIMYAMYTRKYCDAEKKNCLAILRDLHVLSPTKSTKVIFGMPLVCYVCMYVCMHVCMYGCVPC